MEPSVRSAYLCEHCGCEVLKKTHERHKTLYYNSSTKQWIKKRRFEATEAESFSSDVDDVFDEAGLQNDSCCHP